MKRRAKIIATLGPATADETTLRKLIEAGADVLRFNLSHGTPAGHRQNLRLVRRVASELGREIPVLLDLMGPRFRLGTLAEPRQLRRGQHLALGAEPDGADLPIEDAALLHRLHRGDRVLIDNGLVELVVLSKRGDKVKARVVHGGTISTRKGINLPDSKIPFSISERDRADVALAVEEDADYLGASYIARGRDIEALRAVVREHGDEIPIVAKLERGAALEHLDEIVETADAVMVARGDLGVEVPLHQVPVMQKRIIAAGRRLGKPVIVATQMLESMMEQPRPTRAESSDVANAVFDGADALMLSGETAAGKHPIEVVKTMARIVVEAEAYQLERVAEGLPLPARRLADAEPSSRSRRASEPKPLAGEIEIADVIAASAVHAASKLASSRIVAFSQGGFTARRLSRYRPAVPAVVFTTDARVARQMQLLWGVSPIHLEHEVQHRQDLIEVVERKLLLRREIRLGECLILLMGHPIQEKPLTNLLRIHRVRRR